MIKVKLITHTEGKKITADEHPIVNDKHYCEIIEINPSIKYTYDGVKGGCIADNFDDTLTDIKDKATRKIAFDEWFEENWTKSFSDFGFAAPIVYDEEEDEEYELNSIDQFINNGRNLMLKDDFDAIKSVLTDIAMEEIEVEWEE